VQSQLVEQFVLLRAVRATIPARRDARRDHLCDGFIDTRLIRWIGLVVLVRPYRGPRRADETQLTRWLPSTWRTVPPNAV
jgi:hypothetical protein